MKLLPLFISSALFLPFSASHAASFDCDKASTAIEKAICADDLLSEYDEIMAYAYQQLQLLAKGNMDEYKEKQREWVKNRDSKCAGGNADCLLGVYADQIRELESAVVGLNSRGSKCEGIYQYHHLVSLDANDTTGVGSDVLIASDLDKGHLTFSLGIQGSNGHSCTFRGIARRTPEGFNWSSYLPGVGDANSPECELTFSTWDSKQFVSLKALRGNDAADPMHGAACHAYFCGMRAGLPPDNSVFQTAEGKDCSAIRDGLLDSQEIPD